MHKNTSKGRPVVRAGKRILLSDLVKSGYKGRTTIDQSAVTFHQGKVDEAAEVSINSKHWASGIFPSLSKKDIEKALAFMG